MFVIVQNERIYFFYLGIESLSSQTPVSVSSISPPLSSSESVSFLPSEDPTLPSSDSVVSSSTDLFRSSLAPLDFDSEFSASSKGIYSVKIHNVTCFF